MQEVNHLCKQLLGLLLACNILELDAYLAVFIDLGIGFAEAAHAHKASATSLLHGLHHVIAKPYHQSKRQYIIDDSPYRRNGLRYLLSKGCACCIHTLNLTEVIDTSGLIYGVIAVQSVLDGSIIELHLIYIPV